ncbi:unnamed protein product [Psylliodes chrysocephalus]|uniref:SEA domain-containing protein n=1 Tax=Psylliodes chrysocephalus TaxID=3402493 RepID=A0A9P0CTA3_9CUCU|nr:unnamed protein product [Psylliodes chrysocephala]
MDADSSYGGSDTTQDSNVGLHEHHSINEKSNGSEDNPQHGNITTAVHVISLVGGSNEETPDNTYYHKNEITLPVNGNGDDQTDFQNSNNSKLPHYLATANLNINESLEHHSNLEEMNRNYKSSHKLSPESSQLHSSGPNGIDNPAFVEDNRSTFHNDKKPYKNELDVNSLTSNDEYLTEAVNLELINLKPSSGIHNGIKEPCESNNSKNLTSIPIKKDDDDGRSPYDEYFVPVNEHRKYIRGEKLYLTRDSRAEKTKSKCICWTIVICIVATAVILGILAAVGALGNQGQLPQPVEVTGRNFQNDNDIVKAGINAPTFSSSSQSSEPPVDTFIDSPTDPPTDFPTNHSTDPPSNPLTDPSSNPITDPPTDPPTNKPDDLYHPFSHHPALWPVESAPSSTETSTNLPSSSSPVSVTPDPFVAIIGSSDAPSTNSSVNEVTNSSVSEITDSSVSEVSSSEASLRFVEPISPVGAEEDTATVPNVLDLDLTIDNMDYKIDLSDPESSEYKALSSSVEQLLKENVLDQIAPLDDKSSDIQIRVFEFSPGSVIVRTRISWNRDSNAPLSGINETLIQEKIKEFLRTNTGLLGNYHIDQNKMAFRKIPDACLETNNGCEHLCFFDYNHLNFTCTCPDNKKLMRDQKHCELNDAVEKLQEQWMNPGDKAAIPEYRNFYQHGESDKYSEYTQETPESTTVPLNNLSEVLQNHTEPTPVPEPEPEPSTEPEIFQRPPSSSEERSFKQILSQPAILNDESFTMMNPVNSESESSAEDDQDKVLEMISGTLLDPTTDSSEIVHNNDAREDKSPEITKQDFYYDVLREQLNRYEQLNADKERTTKPNNEYGLGRVFTPIAEVFTPAPVSTTQLSDVYTARPTPKPELHYHTEKTQMQMETSMESEPMVHDEHMSPFLPDIDNDTFVNSLHSEEHLTDHNFEIHENTSVPVPVPVTKPPSLEFDQINRTNPFDNFTSDSMEHFDVKPEVVIIIDDKDDNVKTESPTTTEESTTLEITTEDIALNKNEVTPLNNTQLFNNFNDTHITEILSTTNENDNDGTTENIVDITNSLDNENNSIENIKDVTETIQNTTEMIHITEKIQNDTNSLQQGMIILEENIQNTTDNIMQNITENIQNTTTENIQNTTDNIMQNVTKNIQNTTDNIIQNVTENTQNTTTENIQNTTDNMQNVTENIQNTTEIIQIATDNIQNATAENIQNRTENIQNITTETINTVTDKTYPDIISKIEDDSTITDDLKIEGLNAETTTMILPEQLSTTIPDSQNILTELTNIETTTEIEHSTNSSNINTNFKDITTSTEDLIALETTTNTDGNSSNEILDNEIKGSNVTEIQADILETLRTSVNVTKDNVTEETSTTLDPQQYEVKESTDDLTTTEKLFVTHRPSTEKPEVQENGFELKPNTEEPKQLQDEPEEDLSIEPLETYTTEENNRINFESNEIDNDIFAIKNNSVEKPVTEDFVLPKVSRCNPGQFQCLNGTSVKDGSYCIDIGDRCDSIFDCSDGSDETNCVEQGCPNNFKCAGNQCLKRHLVCDGIQNCNDGSDEINCGNWTCNSDEFSCGPSNRCISLKWKCDSRQNCPDGSDENDCIRLGPCSDNFFKMYRRQPTAYQYLGDATDTEIVLIRKMRMKKCAPSYPLYKKSHIIKAVLTDFQTKFSSFGFTNDAVLLKLQKPINVNLNVSAVCLPKDEIVPRQLCIVAGWGINKPGVGFSYSLIFMEEQDMLHARSFFIITVDAAIPSLLTSTFNRYARM